jgi:hypothetical protein
MLFFCRKISFVRLCKKKRKKILKKVLTGKSIGDIIILASERWYTQSAAEPEP